MKKIYLFAAGLILSGSMLGQGAAVPTMKLEKGSLPANAKAPISVTVSPARTLGPKYWVDPVGDLMNNFGIDLTGASTGQSQGTFLDVIYQDSTVTLSSSTNGTRQVSDILLGSILDPMSPNLLPTFTPIVTKFESYSIDSVQILGSYVKVNPGVTDTLYTWLVWGDSTNANVFIKRNTSSIWVSPISTWRKSIIGAKVSGATGAAGNKIKAAAPAANRMLVKYVLTAADEASGPGYSNVISIALPTPANIPAGNIVSCFYTFVPGAANAVGDCAYAFTGAPATQNVNGFAGLIWGQTSPAVTAVSNYQNHQVDPDGWNMGTTYGKEQRHALYSVTYTNSLWGDLVTAPLVYYSIYSNTSVNVNELNNNFTLGQNSPNPFDNQTKIGYQLKTQAKNVSLVIYDVTGVKLFEKTQSDVAAGIYSVDVKDIDFASGMYFYSLIVDGNKATKKMIVK